MSFLFAAVDTRLAAILFAGRGISGTPTSAVAIPANRFRQRLGDAPLNDPAFPLEGFDRAVEFWPDELFQVPRLMNPLETRGLRDVRYTLRVGCVYGPSLSGVLYPAPATSEAAATSILTARRRALSDAYQLQTAMLQPALYQDAGAESSDPRIVAIREAGPVRLQDLGAGRLVSEIPLVLTLDVAQTSRYEPA